MAGLKRKYGTSAFVGRRRLSEKVTGGRPRGFRGGAQFARRALLGLMEKKVVETASASYACDTTGSVTLVNGMAQGSDFTNRIGRKYTNVAVQLEGYLGPQDSNVGTTKCRIMLIYDAQPNGALPAITDVLTASTSNAFMNLNNRDRFKVLCDENYTRSNQQHGVTSVRRQSDCSKHLHLQEDQPGDHLRWYHCSHR